MSAGVLVLRGGPVSVALERRRLVVAGVLGTAVVLLGLAGLSQGADPATPGEVLAALTGDSPAGVVIREWRLPRVLAAAAFGAALGVAGALFQAVTRNPMGSPDVIGLDAGAYTGALVALTVLQGTPVQLALCALAGAAAAAAAVTALSSGTATAGLRLVVVGVAVNAMLGALNSWIVLRTDLDTAIAAVSWSAGTLNGIDLDELHLPLAVLAALALAAASRSAALAQLGLGTSLAVTTGVRSRALTAQVVAIGVGCTATVTAVAGPVAFIALAAPQIGRRLVRAPGVPLLPAALTGAVLLQASDLVAQLLLAPVSLPVGVVTTAVGGCYLLWLLTGEVRRR